MARDAATAAEVPQTVASRDTDSSNTSTPRTSLDGDRLTQHLQVNLN